MLYQLDLGLWNSVFAVPTALVDHHLKLCKENELKLFLWLLRHSGQAFDSQTLAGGTGIPEAYLDDCAQYWVQAGLLSRAEGILSPAEQPAPRLSAPTAAQAAPQPAAAPVVEKKMLRPDAMYIAQRMRENPGLAHVLHEAESILGKTLSPSLSAVIINAHDDYNLPPEVITMLISYVKSVGKTATAYIESLARNWSDSGVDSLSAAERKIEELSQRSMAWKKVVSATGIPHRTPSQKEADEACRWIYNLHLSPEIIAEGYERCVDNIGKFSMKYMAKIFDGWHSLGLATPEAVREHETQYKARHSGAPSSTFDIEDFEKLNVFDILEK